MAKKKANSEKAAPESQDFEQAVEELESIVRRLEQGGGTLEESLTDYSKAIDLLKNCHARLEDAERKIEILSGIDAEGNPITEPFEDLESTLVEKQGLRGERRTAASKPKARSRNAASDDSGGLF